LDKGEEKEGKGRTYGEREGDLDGLGIFVWVAHVAVDLGVMSE
jgi:hypothetical protein